MFKKIGVVTALSSAILFGGAFSSNVDASSNVDTQTDQLRTNLQYQVYYSINGQSGQVDKDEVFNLVNKALSKIKNGENIDWLKQTVEQELQKEDQQAKEDQTNKEPSKEEKQAEKEDQQAKQEDKSKEEGQQAKQEDQSKEDQQAKQEESANEEQANPVEEQPEANIQQPEQEPEQEETQQEQSDELSQFEQEVVELTNQEREKQGLAPLQVDTELSKVAKEKSRDMAENNYFDHNSPVHGSPFDMMQSYGIEYRTAGENIAQGQRTPAEVVDAWMNSEGHRANILNGDYTHIGVGYIEQGNHWTQQFIGK